MTGMGIKRRRLLAAGAALAALGCFSFEAGAQAAPEAGAFIESLADKAVAALTEKNTPREERIRRFRLLLNEHFAVEIIARWVLGQGWRRASEAEKAEYLGLFEDLIVFSYVDRFTEYAGERLTVFKTLKTENGDAIVYSIIARPNMPEPLEVDWRIRTRDGRYKIVDVMVKGISMGVTQSQEFASVMNRNNGSMAGFLGELRERVRKGA
ncbi:MAG: ABC transporter substrate-binding protein [Pseudomonadota bacterium]